MSQSDRALALCREYDQLSTQIKALTGKIGDALACCPVNILAETTNLPTDSKGRYYTHLARALESFEAVDEYGFHPFLAWLTDEEKAPILAECKPCQQAYEYIKQRKQARKRLGAVKRSIRIIGRTGK